jgi:outer membrane protein
LSTPASHRHRFVSVWSIILGALIAAPARPAFRPPGQDQPIKKGETLTLARCVEIGLEREPAIAAARGSVDADRSRVREAESAYWPQVDLSGSVSRQSVGPRSSLGFTTNAVTFNSYSAGASLSQTIWDFGRTSSQVRLNRYTYQASQSSLDNTVETVTLNVKAAYYGVLAAQRNLQVADESVAQNKLHLDQAKGFYDVGLKPLYDVTQAEANLSNAQLTRIKAANAVKRAFSLLNQAMGVVDAPEYTIEDNLAFAPYGVTFEEALDKAYANRPDLRSQVALRQAAQAAVSLARSGFFPILSGSAAYDYAGNAFPLSSGWNIGLTLTFPLFSGFLTTYQVEEAKANLSVQRADEDTLRQQIYIDVQQAYLTLVEAQDLIPVAELGVKYAQQNLDLANGEYKEGLGNPVTVSDAETAMITAQVAYYSALYEFKIAQATLEKAMGLR